MAIHDTLVANYALPARRWSRPYPITLSDTNGDKNLMLNGTMPYRFLHNAGTSGSVNIIYPGDATARKLWINQGGVVEGGLWEHARSTGATAGVELYGLLGVEGVES